MFKKILTQLEKELEEKHKRDRENYNAFDTVAVLIWGVLSFFHLIYDSQIYFYGNYIIYSVVIGSIGFIFTYKYFSKNLKFSAWSDIILLIIIFMMSIWTIPRLLHVFYYEPKFLCVNAIITDKVTMLDTNDRGRFSFDLDYTNTNQISRELIGFSSLNGLTRDEYESLPKVGENINICGNISKVGFSYQYIEHINKKRYNK